MLFTTFDAMGIRVDISLPIGTVAAPLWNELFGIQRAPSDGAVNVWPCPLLVELELVIEGSTCCTYAFEELLLVFEPVFVHVCFDCCRCGPKGSLSAPKLPSLG